MIAARRIIAALHHPDIKETLNMSTNTDKEVTLLQATRDMNKALVILERGFGSYNRDTLHRMLWAIASGLVTYEALAAELDVTNSQVSRAARTLHLRNYNGDDGLGLIDITFDLMNPRTKIVSLSKAGRTLLAAEYKAITGKTIRGFLQGV